MMPLSAPTARWNFEPSSCVWWVHDALTLLVHDFNIYINFCIKNTPSSKGAI